MSKKTLRAASALICALGLLLSGAVNAACSVATQQLSISLGTASAFNINSTALASSGAGGMSCTGISIALLADNSLSGIISSTTGQMNLVNEQDTRYKIPYGVYADSGYKNAFNTATALEYGKSGLDLLGLAVISGGLNVTLYVRTTTGATTPVPAGTYSDTITIFWKYHLCSALLCIGNSVEDSSGTSKIKISVVVTKDCKIDSTQSITFAPSALVESFATVTPTVQLTCSLNTPYTAYINNGLNYSAPWRRMKKTNPDAYLQYNLYAPNASTVWSSTSPISASGSGGPQIISYTARINSSQPPASAGTYTDTVQFVVEY